MAYHRDRRDDSCNSNLEPNILGYQLIGDSQFLRFSEQLLRRQRKKEHGIAYLGLCVSGQTVGDLLRRVRENFYPTSKRSILMIGTNDLLKNTSIGVMRNNLDALVDELFTKGVTKLILLTVPPVPRLANSYDHWHRLKEYNDHIKGRHDGDDIVVINAYSKFIKYRNERVSSRSSTTSLNSSDCRRSLSKNSDSNTRSPLNNAQPRRRGISACSILYPEEIVRRMETPAKYKLNLRISIGEKRKVYKLTDSSDSPDHSSGGSSPDYASPSPAKRRIYSSNFSLVEDDHDDRFVDEDSGSQINDIAEEIRTDLFEEFFSRSSGRKDLIHFNYEGLRIIRQLLLNEISP